MGKMQAYVARAMHRNWVSIPHVTHHDEADITELERRRKAWNASHPDDKRTVLPVLIKASVAALQQFPKFNCSLSADGATLFSKNYFHIGVAVDAPSGLLVPVLRDCDKKDVAQIARELAQISPFELVVLVVLGDLIQQGITHNDFSLSGATLAIVTFGFWSLVLSWVTYKWRAAERVLEGIPTVLVRDGEVLEGNMKRDRLTRGELEAEMRLAGIARLAEVRWAILEPQGAQRCLFRRLQYNRTASRESRSELPRCHHQWKVPRNDLPDNANGFANCVSEKGPLHRQSFAGNLVRPTGVIF